MVSVVEKCVKKNVEIPAWLRRVKEYVENPVQHFPINAVFYDLVFSKYRTIVQHVQQ